MAINTYATLQTAIGNWLARSDLTDRIPEFIDLFEKKINRKLKTFEMETRSQSTLTGEYIPVPTDYLNLRRMHIEGSPDKIVRYLAPDELTRQNRSTAQGTPTHYTIVDGQFRFAPIPDASVTLEIIYNKKVPALSDSNTTNWLLDDHNDLYLFGSLTLAEPYLRNDNRFILWKSQADEIWDEIFEADIRKKYGDVPLAMQPEVWE